QKTANEAGAQKVELQSTNYSINSQNNGGSMQFQISGSVSFTITPPDKAPDVMAALTKKGYQASLNMSTNRGGPCGASVVPMLQMLRYNNESSSHISFL